MEGSHEYKNFKLESDRLLLRTFELKDSEAVAFLCNNIEIHNNTLTIPYPYSIQDAIDFISYQIDNFDPDRELNLTIIDKTTEELVGCVGIICSQIHKRCEIGYWIGKPYWNKNYATEAVKCFISYLFDVKDYNKVFSRHFDSNPASGKVMKKVGMKYEGTHREHYLKRGEFMDVVNYSILKSEYEKIKSS